MEACEKCGYIWRKTKNVKSCPNCDFYNESTEKIEDKRLEISGSKTINTRNIKNWL